MSRKIIKSGLIGGVIVFVWGMVSWMVFPWHKTEFKKFSDERSVKYCIEENAPESGLYQLPSMNHHNDESRMNAEKKMMEGPFAFVAVQLHGKVLGVAASKVAMLIVDLIVACIVAWLLFQTRLDYKKSVLFVGLIGLVIGVMHSVPLVIWIGFPATFAFTIVIKSIVGWVLAGFAMAKLAKR